MRCCQQCDIMAYQQLASSTRERSSRTTRSTAVGSPCSVDGSSPDWNSAIIRILTVDSTTRRSRTTSRTSPAEIPSYTVFNLSGEVYLTRNVRLIGGISNLGDERYYSRVFPFGNGSIDPAPARSGYAGLSVSF